MSESLAVDGNLTLQPAASPYHVKVAVDAPQHTGLAAPLDYLSECSLAPGTMVHVPFGRRETPGIGVDRGIAFIRERLGSWN